jgi:hypothetical protein
MLHQALTLVMDATGTTTYLQNTCSWEDIRQVLHYHTIIYKLMAEMSLMKGTVMDILYFLLLGNTKETASQWNKY